MNKIFITLSLVFCVSCKKLPEITWCALNGDGSAQCLPPGDKEPHTVPANDLENYLCASPDDVEKLINACHKNSK